MASAYASGRSRELAIPHRRGLDRIVGGRVEQERVTARALQPAARACHRVVGIERPGDQDGRERAGCKSRRSRPHDVLGDRVAAHAAVAEQVRALRRDDVRRVRDDEVEPLAFDGLEEAAEPRLDVVDTVERCVEACVGERTRVDVGRDDALRVRREQDRLDPVPGAEVECALARAAHGEVGERDRRPVHAGHVVGVPVRGGAVIRCDQQLVVRDDARRAANGAVVVDEQTGLREQCTKLFADELVDAIARDGNAEQEEPDEHGQLVRLAEPAQVGGQLGRPHEQLVPGREPPLDSLRVVTRCAEQPSQLDAVVEIRAWRIRSHAARRACSP